MENTRPGQPARPPHLDLFLASTLFFLTLLLFSVTLKNGFVNFDDPTYVTDNPTVQAGLTWPGVIYAFTANVSSNWHPLTMLSHMLDCQVFGLKAWGHHLTSVCLHAVNTALVFLVLRRLTGTTWRSFWVAIFFGLHPLRVESVAWVAERKDVLSSLFALLTLFAYARFLAEKRWGFYWAALAFFTCGLMSKPMLVTLPFVLWLLDFWPLRRWHWSSARRLILEKIPFLVLAAGTCLATITTQKTAIISFHALPLSERIGHACVAYVRYLGKIFCPIHLSAFYPQMPNLSLTTILLATCLLLAISAIVLLLIGRFPYLAVGWFWFVGMLVPVIGLVQVGEQFMADRYTYFPMLGILLAVVWLVEEITRPFQQRKKILFSSATVLALGCALLTFRQIQFWQNGEVLFRHALAVTQHNGPAHFLLAGYLRVQGRHQEAIKELKEGMQFEPPDAELNENLGDELVIVRNSQAAVAAYLKSLELNPDSADVGNKLGMLLHREGRNAEAIQVFQFALQYNPKVEAIHLNLGNAFVQVGKLPEAEVAFKQALTLNPDDVDAHNNLGAILFRMHQPDAAMEQFQAVLKLDPTNAEASRNLAVILNLKHAALAPEK